MSSVTDLSAQAPSPTAGAAQRAAVQVMILGIYHMANPNRDVADIPVDDMLLPARQRQLERLAAQLQQFHPTKVAVEAISLGPNYVFKSPLDPADLTSMVSEVYQVGERVALTARLDRIYGVNSAPNLSFDSIQALDQRLTAGKRMTDLFAQAQRFAADGQAQLQTGTVSQSLAWMNSPEAIQRNQDLFIKSLVIQDGDDQPAAKVNADWYERNLRIWGKIMQIAKPGDRILVIYGQGHAFWLRTLAQQMPGYRLVDPVPYLEADPEKPAR